MKRVVNVSIDSPKSWTQDGLIFTELVRQEYGTNHCVFSAGTVEGHTVENGIPPVDKVFLKWQKDGDPGGMLLMRPDELAAIAWCCTGVLWSGLLEGVLDANEQPK